MREPVQKLVERYQQNLYAAAFNVCKNQMDAEDIVQEAFLQYYTSKKEFDDEQHIRAWLIRVVINKAKNCNLTFWRRNKCSLDDYIETLVFETPASKELFEEVMKLPEKALAFFCFAVYHSFCENARISWKFRLREAVSCTSGNIAAPETTW